MFGWFKKRPRPILASAEEREATLAGLHPLFRVVDAAFHAYLEVLTANPQWTDDQIEQELIRGRGVEGGLAEECVTFGPMAWAREVVEELGVECSPLYRLRSMIDGSEQDLPLANEMAYAWARAMIALYRTPERIEVFKLVSIRSAELDTVNNALLAGRSPRGGKLEPSLVHFRRAGESGAPASPGP
jgi:hypothetical protein